MKSFKFNSKRNGVALVTVLIIISLLAILVVAFISTSQIDHQSSTAFADTQRAKLVAKGAVAHAVEILRNNIPDPAGIDKRIGALPGQTQNPGATATALNWVVNPGRLTLIDEEHNTRIIDLHSGEVDTDPDSTEDPDVYSVDLNEPVPGKVDAAGKAIPTITYALKSNGESDRGAPRPTMRVKWVNLLKDPSKPASPSNPIIARHAFWMDDESGKINFNTAMGKPDPGDNEKFSDQLKLKLFPPVFDGGLDSSITMFKQIDGDGNPIPREFALGNSRSVNLDVLFDDPAELNRDQMMAHSMLRGFSRYPEAVMDFVKIDDEARKTEWWYANRYNLTSYSRSPEFNAFGKPRFMTTWAPLSLEGGPTYQLPFVYNGPGTVSTDPRVGGVLHLSGLLGMLKINARDQDVTVDEDGEIKDAEISSRTVVNRAQMEMLMRYFQRDFPGYPGNFISKYGELECAQIALNILSMSRFATSPLAYGISGDSYSDRLADAAGAITFHPSSAQGVMKNKSYDPARKNDPDNKEYTKQNPERHYWWYQPNVGFMADPPDLEDPESVEAIPMLPIHSGPFITEVRMVLKPEPAMRKRGKRWRPVPDKRWLSIKFQVEYYLPGVTGPVRVQKFPFKMDCISIDRDGEDLLRLGYEGTSRDWDHTYPTKRSHPAATGLGAFRIQGGRNARILSFTEDTPNRNRRAIDGGLLYIGTNPNKLGMKLSTANPPKQFDKEETVSLSIAFRGGMSIHSTGFERPIRNPAPAQMIPLGVKEEDVLEARIDVDMLETIPRSISWQILDPRLSAWKDQWAVEIEDDNTAGTLGHVNETSEWTEPEEDSPEKSKFRSIPRGNRSDKIVGYKIQRGEEMESNSRVSTKGFWSLIHTGVQNEVPWRTLALNMEPIGNVSGPPDWLLMDLMGTTQPIQHDQRKINSTLPDEFSTVSYMHSTTGAINLNNKTYPANNPYFQAPIRTKPLEAVFKHLRSDTEIKALLGGIESYQNSNVFGYVGDLARVNGYAIGESEWERETLLRNMISCLTTRSNTFGVWGVGQVVKKMRNNENWGEFEDGDSVRGEKRFFAIVERYVWPGKDGVPGNAHVDENGELDRLGIHVSEPNIPLNDKSVRDLLFQLPGSPPFKRGGRGRLHLDEKGTHPEFDGPQEVEMNHYAQAALGEVVWKHSPLEDAYNPPQAVTKYRVVYFKYLDE